jgi:hypothetical protein
MTKSSICCKDIERLRGVKSPFSKMIALGFYDGPTSGIVECESCFAAYKFTMIDWDNRQEIRVFSLASLPAQSLEEVVGILSPYELPHWPMWVPRWQFPSDDIKADLNRRIEEILAKAEPVHTIVAWSRYGETLVAAKSVDEGELTHIQDWFSTEHQKTERDWFSFLGLQKST